MSQQDGYQYSLGAVLQELTTTNYDGQSPQFEQQYRQQLKEMKESNQIEEENEEEEDKEVELGEFKQDQEEQDQEEQDQQDQENGKQNQEELDQDLELDQEEQEELALEEQDQEDQDQEEQEELEQNIDELMEEGNSDEQENSQDDSDEKLDVFQKMKLLQVQRSQGIGTEDVQQEVPQKDTSLPQLSQQSESKNLDQLSLEQELSQPSELKIQDQSQEQSQKVPSKDDPQSSQEDVKFVRAEGPKPRTQSPKPRVQTVTNIQMVNIQVVNIVEVNENVTKLTKSKVLQKQPAQILDIVDVSNENDAIQQPSQQKQKQKQFKEIKQETPTSFILIDEDWNDDEIQIISEKRVVQKNGWEECSIGDTKGVSPKFLGNRRVNLRRAKPAETFKYFFFDKFQKGILLQMGDQQTTFEDVLQFIGTKIFMGYMKFPTLKDYYRQEPILSTQISELMDSKQFTYLESKLELNQKIYQNTLVNIKQEEMDKQDNQDEFLRQASRKFNKKLSQSLYPGQWLVLIKNQSLQAVTQNLELFQLIDRDSNYILKQFFWTLDRKSLQNRIIDLLMPYAGLNHVVFVEQRLLDGQTIFLLYQKKILVCSWNQNSNLLPQSISRRIFRNQSMFSLAQKDEVLVFPGFEYLQQIQPVLSSVSRHFLISEKISIVPTEGSHQVLAFYFTLETIINNCYCLYPSGNYKEYRIQLAQSLLREPLMLFSKEVIPIERPLQFSVSIQTTESFRLQLEKALHCPIFDGNARCVVCLHEGTLSKTQASCLGCSDTLAYKQFLCLLPCFRKFHMDPAKYLEPRDAKLVVGYYDDLPVDEVQQQGKPDTSDLEAIYELQHRNFDETDYYAQQFGVPINYEDDFRNKTKWVKKQTKRPAPRQPSAPRKKAPPERKVTFDLPGQGNQGNTQERKKRGGGRKPQQSNLAQMPHQQQQQQQPGEQNAMVDFFSMVRKKVMQNQQPPN